MGFSLTNFKMDRRKFLGIFSASVFSALMPRQASGKPDYRQNKNVPDNYVQNRETPGFYIRSANPFLGVDANNWALVVKGMVKNPVTLVYEDLIGLPMVSQVSRLKCVECWSAKAKWEGFRMQDLVDRVKICIPDLCRLLLRKFQTGRTAPPARPYGFAHGRQVVVQRPRLPFAPDSAVQIWVQKYQIHHWH